MANMVNTVEWQMQQKWGKLTGIFLNISENVLKIHSKEQLHSVIFSEDVKQNLTPT